MNSNEAEKILRDNLKDLPEPLKSAVVFTLANWPKWQHEFCESDAAKEFLAGLKQIPMTSHEVDEKLIDKLNNAEKHLRDNLDVWLSLEDLPHEIWRDVVGYEGRYQVSNFGRVKSFKHKHPKIMSANEQSKGYMLLRLYKNGKSKNFGIHILVAQAFISNPEQKGEVDHRNGDKTNNCVWNLDWVTRRENAVRAYQLGLIPVQKGTQSHFAKLKADAVTYIRENPDGLSTKELMKKFNVSKETVRRVRIGKTYSDVI